MSRAGDSLCLREPHPRCPHGGIQPATMGRVRVRRVCRVYLGFEPFPPFPIHSPVSPEHPWVPRMPALKGGILMRETKVLPPTLPIIRNTEEILTHFASQCGPKWVVRTNHSPSQGGLDRHPSGAHDQNDWFLDWLEALLQKNVVF